jgi:hypothetical protein
MVTLNVTNRIIMKITVGLIPTRQRFDNGLLKKFNYKSSDFINFCGVIGYNFFLL